MEFVMRSVPQCDNAIVTIDLTDKDADDAPHVEPLPEQLDDAPESFMGDGAYDPSPAPDAALYGSADGVVRCDLLYCLATASRAPADHRISAASVGRSIRDVYPLPFSTSAYKR